jgi:hypothetical protein
MKRFFCYWTKSTPAFLYCKTINDLANRIYYLVISPSSANQTTFRAHGHFGPIAYFFDRVFPDKYRRSPRHFPSSSLSSFFLSSLMVVPCPSLVPTLVDCSLSILVSYAFAFVLRCCVEVTGGALCYVSTHSMAMLLVGGSHGWISTGDQC